MKAFLEGKYLANLVKIEWHLYNSKNLDEECMEHEHQQINHYLIQERPANYKETKPQ